MAATFEGNSKSDGFAAVTEFANVLERGVVWFELAQRKIDRDIYKRIVRLKARRIQL